MSCTVHSRYQGEVQFICHSCQDEFEEEFHVETDRSRNKLILISVLCLLFMIGEVVGGYLANSLAIVTDAAHLLSDLASFLVSLFTLWLTKKPATDRHSFGFHRAEILGAIVSVILIWTLTGLLIYEAVNRLYNPAKVNGKIMFIVASAGFVVNTIMAIVLHIPSSKENKDEELNLLSQEHSHSGHSHGSMSLRAAMIHVIGDIIQSIGVMIAACVIWYNPSISWVDPLCTFLFSLIVLYTTLKLISESVHILMEGTPTGLKSHQILNYLKSEKGVIDIHDLHVWSIKPGKPALSVHVNIQDPQHSQAVLQTIQAGLLTHFNICHSTIQIEQ